MPAPIEPSTVLLHYFWKIKPSLFDKSQPVSRWISAENTRSQKRKITPTNAYMLQNNIHWWEFVTLIFKVMLIKKIWYETGLQIGIFTFIGFFLD
jgi:hypothetical protein